MRFVFLLAVALVVASCEAPVTLFTDQAFQAAAPEVVNAWRGLAPFHWASVQALAPGPTSLRAALTHWEGQALIGAAVSADEAHQLVRDFPQVQMVFLGSGFLPPDVASITIRRTDAWTLVARQVAHPGKAVAFFPLDAVPDEINAFVRAWTLAGGGPMTTALGPRGDLFSPLPSQVFFWTGQESDALALSLPASVAVHGNPGLRRTPGASGLTWALAKEGLGEFLWKAVHPAPSGRQFLPLETISTSR